jgi:hypothetical protein
MDSFFIYVTAFAVLLLMVCLIGVGLLMRFQSAKDEFPPGANVCPDGWVNTSGTLCTAPAGITVSGTAPTGITYNVSPATAVDFGTTTKCVQKKWANNNNISWDGVSNYTQCP